MDSILRSTIFSWNETIEMRLKFCGNLYLLILSYFQQIKVILLLLTRQHSGQQFFLVQCGPRVPHSQGLTISNLRLILAATHVSMVQFSPLFPLREFLSCDLLHPVCCIRTNLLLQLCTVRIKIEQCRERMLPEGCSGYNWIYLIAIFFVFR